MDKTLIDEIVNNDLTKIIESLDDDFTQFSLDKITMLVPKLIVAAEKYKKLKGSDKKELVMELLKNIIRKYDNVEDDSILDSIMFELVPSMIDTLISVDKKKLKLKKKNILEFLKCLKKIKRKKLSV